MSARAEGLCLLAHLTGGGTLSSQPGGTFIGQLMTWLHGSR